MWKAPAMPPNPGSSAVVRLNEDGSVNVSIGGVDIGQGALTAMAQLAAEGLGVKMNDVRVNMVDTDYSPYEWQTVASRLTWSMGNAVLRAADSARSQILQTSLRPGEDVGDSTSLMPGDQPNRRIQAAERPGHLRHATT
jgi:CO/xanthine dehydrogenase Mo-binding subunit